MSNLILVSGDGHAGPPPDAYRPYLDRIALEHFDGFLSDHERWTGAMRDMARFSDETLDCLDQRGAIRSGGESGAWDLERRLREMDDEGIAAEALISHHQLQGQPFYSPMCQEWGPELRWAGVRAFNRWLADHMDGAQHRFIAMAEPGPCVDMDATVQELHWVADHGFRMVDVPGMVLNADLPPLLSDYYDPFWRTCDERGLVLGAHAGWGQPQDYCVPYWEDLIAKFGAGAFSDDRLIRGRGAGMMMQQQGEAEPFALTIAYGRAMWQLMLAGVFDRHPNLSLVLTEVRADWVPAMLELLDQRVDSGAANVAMKPSEYFARNVYVTPSSPRRHEVEMRHEIGISRMLFARDYPHPEGTWPNTWDWIRDAFRGVPEDEARLLLGENAIACFGMNRTKLAEIAARIGPAPGDLLGEFSISEDLIDTFDLRAGYRKPKNYFSEDEFQDSFTSDLAALGRE